MTILSFVAGFQKRSNSYVTGNQDQPAIAVLKNGSHVVAWSSEGQDGSDRGVYIKRYDPQGNPLNTPEIKVNYYVTGEQSRPSIAALSNGGFVVIWDSYAEDGHGLGVYGQRYNSNGTLNGAKFLVNSSTYGNQFDTSVTSLSTGGYAVIFTQENSQTGNDIYVRFYNSSFSPILNQFRVNQHLDGNQKNPVIASGVDGTVLAVWQSLEQDGSGHGVYGRLYSSTGGVLSPEFQVNSTAIGSQFHPKAAALTGGGYIVTWASTDAQDGAGRGVFAQRLDASGTKIGSEFQVNSFTADDQQVPSVTALVDGGWLIVWQSAGDQDGSGYGVFGQRYDADGAVVGGEFRLNADVAGNQLAPAVAGRLDGGWVAAWETEGQDHNDPYYLVGIQSRVWGHAVTAPVLTGKDREMPLNSSTDVISLLRIERDVAMPGLPAG